MKTEITQENLHDLFDYKDGNLYWREDKGNIKAGDKAGSEGKRYWKIQINYKGYSLSRLVHLYHHGYLPENRLMRSDKLNGYQVENLEEASKSCIQARQEPNSRNKTGIRGVQVSKRDCIGGWVAVIIVNYKHKTLGQTRDLLEACCLRYAAEQCLGWDTLSESTAAKYVKEHIRGIK